MNSDSPIADAQSTERMTKLAWYDSTYEQSADTCRGAIPGVMISAVIFAAIMLAWHVIANGDSSNLDWLSGFITILGAFTWSLFPATAASVMIPPVNGLFGFAFSARVQIAITGGFSGFLGVILFYLSFAFEDVEFSKASKIPLVLAITLAHWFAVLGAGRPRFWLGRKKYEVKNVDFRPKLKLSRLFLITTIFALLIVSLNFISSDLVYLTAAYLTIQLSLLLLDQVYFAIRNPTVSN